VCSNELDGVRLGMLRGVCLRIVIAIRADVNKEMAEPRMYEPVYHGQRILAAALIATGKL
jgi:hypothetical protein